MIENYGLNNQVILVGNKRNPYPYMKNADFLVHTSYVESQCLAVLEAMALGTPCVVTKSIGINEFAVNEYNCFLAEQNEMDLEKQIKKSMCQYINLDAIKKNAFRTIEQFSDKIVILKIEQIL